MVRKSKARGALSVVIVYFATMLVSLIVIGGAAVYIMNNYINAPASQVDSDNIVNEESDIYTPSLSDNLTVLFIGAEGDVFNAAAAVQFSPVNLQIKVVPISPYTLCTVGSKTETLAYHYKTGGITNLRAGIEDVTGMSFDRYIKLSNDGFAILVEDIGGLYYNIPQDMYYNNEETGEITNFSQGRSTRILWGDDLRKLMIYPEYNGGHDQNVKVTGDICVSIINGYFNNKDTVLKNMRSMFTSMLNNSDSKDIDAKDYEDWKDAMEYMLKNASSPAVFRVLKGVWNEDGTFTPDVTFKDELMDYFGMNYD